MKPDRKTLSELAGAGVKGIRCPKCGCRHLWRLRDTDMIHDRRRVQALQDVQEMCAGNQDDREPG